MNILKIILLWTWCFPQTLLGLIFLIYLKLFSKARCVSLKKEVLVMEIGKNKIIQGLSLGQFIFITKKGNNMKTLRHEYGHTIQNYFFGPFYLLIVGVPSQINVIKFHIYKSFTRKQYANSYPEKWATKLGEKYY